jgi:hypothetical protein
MKTKTKNETKTYPIPVEEPKKDLKKKNKGRRLEKYEKRR